MAKRVAFSARPREQNAALDAFVHGKSTLHPKPEPAADRQRMKRLTFDVPAELHLRMKIGCAREGRDMAEALRELIAQRWPYSPVDN